MKKNMIKNIFTLAFLLCCNCLIIRAQNSSSTKYVIDNIKGKAEIQIASGTQWEPVHNNQTVLGNYRILVGNKLNLTKGKDEKTIYKTKEDVSVDYAWENPHLRPNPIPGTDAVEMGPAPDDSIGFCFITTDGNWKIDGHINNVDSIEAIGINHNSNDTLYVCGYWVFPDCTFYPLLNYTHDSVYVVLPKQDNIIAFKEPIPVTREEDSIVILFYSKQEFNYSELDGIPLDELKKNRSHIEYKIQCYHE